MTGLAWPIYEISRGRSNKCKIEKRGHHFTAGTINQDSNYRQILCVCVSDFANIEQ